MFCYSVGSKEAQACIWKICHWLQFISHHNHTAHCLHPVSPVQGSLSIKSKGTNAHSSSKWGCTAAQFPWLDITKTAAIKFFILQHSELTLALCSFLLLANKNKELKNRGEPPHHSSFYWTITALYRNQLANT